MFLVYNFLNNGDCEWGTIQCAGSHYIQVNMVFCIYSTQQCIVTRHYIADKSVMSNKGKVVPVHATKECMEKGTASILNLGTRWEWSASCLNHFTPVLTAQEAEWTRRWRIVYLGHLRCPCTLVFRITTLQFEYHCFLPIKTDHEAGMSTAPTPLLLHICTVKLFLQLGEVECFYAL